MTQEHSDATSAFPYATHLNILFAQLQKIDITALVSKVKDQWYNQTLCKVNESVVRLGVIRGEYHWHKHDNDDEFFFCLEGNFIVDLEDRSVTLGPLHGITVPRGVIHRTRAPERCVILRIESAGIIPTGD